MPYMHFYITRQVDKCPRNTCTKMATHEVFGPGNSSYGKYCEEHAIEHQKHLGEYWNSQSEPVQTLQIEDTKHDRRP